MLKYILKYFINLISRLILNMSKSVDIKDRFFNYYYKIQFQIVNLNFMLEIQI
jgi:hypothetical protein